MYKEGRIVNTFRLFFDLQGYSLQEIPESFLFDNCVKFYLTDKNNEDMEGFNDVWANILNDDILNAKELNNVVILEQPSDIHKMSMYSNSVDDKENYNSNHSSVRPFDTLILPDSFTEKSESGIPVKINGPEDMKTEDISAIIKENYGRQTSFIFQGEVSKNDGSILSSKSINLEFNVETKGEKQYNMKKGSKPV
jgi:hypothetical protein